MTSVQVGSAVCQAVGLGCFVAWSFYVWAQYPGVLSLPLDVGPFALPLSLVRDLIMALCAVAVVVASPSLRTLCGRPAVTFALSLVACASCAGALLPGQTAGAAQAAGVLYAVGGIGSTLRIAWEESMSLLGVLHITLCFAGGYLVGAFLFVAITLLPADAVWAAFAAMPVASWALLTASSRCAGQASAACGFETPKPGIVRTLRTVSWKILVAIALVYVCYGVVRASQGSVQLPGSGPLADVVLTSLVSILAISFGYLAFRRNVLVAFYVAFPLLALASVLPPAADPYMMVATFASALVAMVLWLLIVEFIVKDGLSALVCVALLRAAQLVGNLLGQGVGGCFPDGSAVAIIVPLCIIGVLLLLVGYRLPSMGSLRAERSEAVPGDGGLVADASAGNGVDPVQVAAERFGLTPREVEVLDVWSQGRAITYIESTLFISKSTVKTHLTHIYAKTGTANREELMVLLDGIAKSDPVPPSAAQGL